MSAPFVQLDAIVDTSFTSDFYLWLLSRYDDNEQLAPDLTLEVIRSMTAEDRLSRGTSLTAGAQMDRAEWAAAAIDKPIKFGPAQFAVDDSGLDLSLELELFVDGSFRIIVGNSDYEDRLPDRRRVADSPRAPHLWFSPNCVSRTRTTWIGLRQGSTRYVPALRR